MIKPGSLAHLRQSGERVFVLAIKPANTHISVEGQNRPVSVQTFSQGQEAIIRIRTEKGLQFATVFLEELQTTEEFANNAVQRVINTLQASGFEAHEMTEEELEAIDDLPVIDPKDKKKVN